MSNPQENNIGLVAGGLIGLGCLTALGVGLITLPVAIGIGAVVAGGFGAKELMNIREEKKAIDLNQAKNEKEIPNSYKKIGKKSDQIAEKKAITEEEKIGKRMGRAIAEEYLENPDEKSKIIEEKYNQLMKLMNNPNSKNIEDLEYEFKIFTFASTLASFFDKDSSHAPELLEAYKKNPQLFVEKTEPEMAEQLGITKSFEDLKKDLRKIRLKEYSTHKETAKRQAIAESAFDEVAYVIKEHKQRPSPAPQSPISGLDNVKARGSK